MKLNKNVAIALLVVFCSAIILIFSRYFWGGNNHLFYFDDDFFYYAKIAQNFYNLGFSTFDGTHLTNGYHPLYFLLMTSILFFTNTDSLSFFYIISGLTVLSVCITFIISQKLIYNMIGNNKISIIVSLFIALVALIIDKGGMEVILVIPIMLYVIYYIVIKRSSINYLLLGFLYSLMILSRLDSIIFIFLLELALMYYYKTNRIKNALLVLLGLMPFFLYLGTNLYFFDTLMPVSGMAKQLRTSYYPVINPFLSLFDRIPNKIIYSLIPSLLTIANIIIYLFKRKTLNDNLKIIIVPSLVFPFLFLLQQSVFSGWILCPWYFYIFIPSLIVVSILFKSGLVKFDNNIFLYIAMLSVIGYSLMFSIGKEPSEYKSYANTNGIKAFERHHKGIYAMGDYAGGPAFVIDSPMIQLEGLAMDKEYLEFIKMGSLKSIFVKYNIQYYIATILSKKDSIWYCFEPASDHSYILKAKCQMKFNPIDSIQSNGDYLYIFDVKSNLSKIE